jgi:hypothetical protein
MTTQIESMPFEFCRQVSGTGRNGMRVVFRELVAVADGRGTETESKELAAGVDGDSGAGTGVDGAATR